MLSRSIIEKVIKKLKMGAEVKNETQYERLLASVQKKVSITSFDKKFRKKRFDKKEMIHEYETP